MTKRSRYDELHDKYHQIITTKTGTRYERLAAMVFKALEERNVVIHDLKLSGQDPEVKHQIDVSVEIGGAIKRVLVECKDFDVSGDKVGLDIIRNFRSVLEDTKADEGIVITCNGFTEDAQKYARSKNIKLAVLRIFETQDMNGRIVRIVIGFVIQRPANPQVTVAISQVNLPQYSEQLAAIGVKNVISNTDPVFFVRGTERHQFNAFVTQRMNDAIKSAGPKAIRITVPSGSWLIQVGSNSPIPFDGIVCAFDVDETQEMLEIASQRVAELILEGFGSADILIYGDQIERRTIDPETGKAT
jgi:Restriction endonuclease